MAATLNSQTIGLANTVMSLMQQLGALQGQIAAAVAQWVQINAAAQLNAMGTCATNADGTLGAADGSPVNGHVINTGLYPTLSRAVSAYDIGLAENLLADVNALLGGSAVAAQASFPNILAVMTGG